MRIGIVSDTHDNRSNVERIVSLFETARVDRVVHTGDITKATTLEVFGRMPVPVCGVYGNNDQERESLEAAAREHGIALVDPPLRLAWQGRRIAVVHDPEDAPAALGEPADVLLHGHTHRYVEERRGDLLVLNPGECAGHLTGHNAVGVLELGSLAFERLRF